MQWNNWNIIMRLFCSSAHDQPSYNRNGSIHCLSSKYDSIKQKLLCNYCIWIMVCTHARQDQSDISFVRSIFFDFIFIVFRPLITNLHWPWINIQVSIWQLEYDIRFSNDHHERSLHSWVFTWLQFKSLKILHVES